jgi:predicted PurR-regulated permease PerM
MKSKLSSQCFGIRFRRRRRYPRRSALLLAVLLLSLVLLPALTVGAAPLESAADRVESGLGDIAGVTESGAANTDNAGSGAASGTANASESGSPINDPGNTSDDLTESGMGLWGILLAVGAAVAAVVLIVALMPKKKGSH